MWVFFTFLIGLSPLIFLHIIDYMSAGDRFAEKEIDTLIRLRSFLFVACAITGAVAITFIFSKFTVKGWMSAFAIYVAPFCMLAYLFVKYLLVYVQFAEDHDFGPGNFTTWITISFSIVYSTFVKTIQFQKEDARLNIHL